MTYTVYYTEQQNVKMSHRKLLFYEYPYYIGLYKIFKRQESIDEKEMFSIRQKYFLFASAGFI